jgi:1-acyl-sn-glycerol-3-phosphate acyltransferase
MTAYEVLERIGFRSFMHRAFRVDLRGAEHVPATGPVILVANHESIFDPFVLALATPRPVRYMAKAELWRYPVLRQAMDWLGTFPVARGSGDLLAMRRGVSLLEEGELLGVFPQGTSKQTVPRRYHRGAARLALQTGAAIVPVRLHGTRGILRPGFPRVAIEVRAPIHVEPAPMTIRAARGLTQQLEESIAA